MRKAFLIGVVLCLCAVVVPATAATARAAHRSSAPKTSALSTAGGAAPVASPLAGATTSLRAKPSPAAAAFIKAARARASHAPAPATGNAATLSADPSTGLLDGQQITVSGSGYAAKSAPDIVECPTGDTNPLDCDVGSVIAAKVDKGGTFSSSFTAIRMIEAFPSGTPIDCATTGACDLTAFDSNLSPLAETPISFADVAIIPPTVSAVPSTGLLDGQKITVSGTNFTPNSFVSFSECQGSTDVFACAVLAAGAKTDASGSFSAPFKVARFIEGIEGTVDCALVSGCEILVSNEDGSEQASAPISFADVAIVPPVMTATPSTDLEDGQTVTVTGSGFSHRDVLGVSECAAGVPDGSECVLEGGLGNVAEVQTDRHGRFTLSFDVARIITLGDGTIDCSVAPGCVIGAVDLEGETGAVDSSVPITFDPSGKPLAPLNLEVRIDPTATIGAGAGTKGNSIALTGTITCDRATPVPVDIQLQVTEPVGTHQAGGGEEGVASCGRNGAKFSVTISSGRRAKTVFVPGSAGVLMTVFADSGSSAEQTTTNDSITLKAPTS